MRNTCTNVHTHYIYIHTHKCMHTHIIYIYTHTNACALTYIYIHIYIYLHPLANIHTHAHTHMLLTHMRIHAHTLIHSKFVYSRARLWRLYHQGNRYSTTECVIEPKKRLVFEAYLTSNTKQPTTQKTDLLVLVKNEDFEKMNRLTVEFYKKEMGTSSMPKSSGISCGKVRLPNSTEANPVSRYAGCR